MRHKAPGQGGSGDGRDTGRPHGQDGGTGGEGIKESDLSIFVRAAAIWILHVATLVVAAWAAVTQAAPLGSRWLIVPLLGAIAYPLSVLAFMVATWPDRLMSALRSSGMVMLYAVLILWIDPDSTGSAVFVVILLSAAITFAMWRSGRAERAAEADGRSSWPGTTAFLM